MLKLRRKPGQSIRVVAQDSGPIVVTVVGVDHGCVTVTKRHGQKVTEQRVWKGGMIPLTATDCCAVEHVDNTMRRAYLAFQLADTTIVEREEVAQAIERDGLDARKS